MATQTETDMETNPASCKVGDVGGGCGATHWKEKTEDEWRQILTPEQFKIARQAGTERAFTGKYWNTKTPGMYACACCGADLFRSETKFDSGTGWPSFYQPITPTAVGEHRDTSHGMVRVESVCGTCNAHLGHVFPDGPRPTGLRYCMNSASLNLKPDAT